MKLNKKKLIILSSIGFSVIAILLILLWTLFGLNMNQVHLQIHQNYEPYMTEQFEESVITNSSLKQNMSVFFINKNKISCHIEKQFPEVKVINIETTFPNGLIIHIAKREGLYALQNKANDNYLILDKDFKIIDIKESFENTFENEILLTSVEYNNASASLGDFITLGDNTTILSNLAKGFLMSNRDTTEQKNLIQSIAILTDEVRQYISNDEKVVKITLEDGFEVYIYSARTKLTDKVALMFSALPEAYPLYHTTHDLEIFQKMDGSLFCKLSIK